MFVFSDESMSFQSQLTAFMDAHIYPNEEHYAEQLAQAEDRFGALPLMDDLKEKARAAGLRNLFVLPSHA